MAPPTAAVLSANRTSTKVADDEPVTSTVAKVLGDVLLTMVQLTTVTVDVDVMDMTVESDTQTLSRIRQSSKRMVEEPYE